MAKLVILSEGMMGRSQELSGEKITLGRVEDNTFQISDPSVSSHHCEVLLRGADVVVRDLNSTNGTYINDERITESVIKPGQILRLGQIELRLENGHQAASKKAAAATSVLPRGVSLNELEQGNRPSGLTTAGKGFAKKTDTANKIFLIVGIIAALIIAGLLVYVFKQASKQ